MVFWPSIGNPWKYWRQILEIECYHKKVRYLYNNLIASGYNHKKLREEFLKVLKKFEKKKGYETIENKRKILPEILKTMGKVMRNPYVKKDKENITNHL